MDLETRTALERQYHESEDFLRDKNSLIVGVYASGILDEANSYLEEALGDIEGKHVLDSGCGTGESTRRLRSRGAVVTGFDISQLRLTEARRRSSLDQDKQQVAFTEAMAERLPFADESFDAVMGKQILHHLEFDLAVCEIIRVLRPGGKAAFLEPLIHNPLLEGYRRLTPHLRSPTEKALSMHDLHAIGSRFSRWQHREFGFLAVLSVLVQVGLGKKVSLENWTKWLQKVDHRLVDTVPFLGRYYWETVIALEK